MLNQTFNELKLEKHPNKTLIGRIERGFDFLGYHFDPEGLSVAKITVENFLSRAIRLYEQESREAIASARLGLYVQRWSRWVIGGLTRCDILLCESILDATCLFLTSPESIFNITHWPVFRYCQICNPRTASLLTTNPPVSSPATSHENFTDSYAI